MSVRSTEERQRDARARLESDENVWIATANNDGVPHLIPLSLAWDGTRIIVATPTDSVTVRNALSSNRVKATLDSADDVVLIDGTAEVLDAATADPELLQAHADRVGWSLTEDTVWSLLLVTPRLIRAWNGVPEITGRVIMRNGEWLS